MIQLSAGKLLEQQLARSMGLNRYAGIMNAAREKDVSSDAAFQRFSQAVFMCKKRLQKAVLRITKGSKKGSNNIL